MGVHFARPAMVYRWKDAASVKVDAQAAGEELERLRIRANGRLDSRDVVEAARAADSPLHPAFEWNDAKAAERWRHEQAGYMIRSIEVVVDRPDGEAAPIRAFVSVKRDEDRSYTSVAHAMSDADLRAQVIADALKELVAWRDRHAELTELAAVFVAIDQARPAK